MNNIEKNPNENKNRDAVNKHLKVVEGNKISDSNGNLVFDAKTFLQDNWFKGEAIIATPNIPSSELEELNQALNLCASNPIDPLDLNVIVYNSLDQKSEPLKLGIKDKHQMFVYIYPEEFFKSDENAREIFDKKIVNVGNFGMYYTNYAT